MLSSHIFFRLTSPSLLPQDMGATALFLAGKMEDCPRKLEHIVIVWHKLKYQDQPPLVPQQGGAMSEV